MSVISLQPLHRAADLFQRAALSANDKHGPILRGWADELSTAPLAVYRDQVGGRARELEGMAQLPHLILVAALDEGFLDDARLTGPSGETTHTFRPGAFEAGLRRIGLTDTILSVGDKPSLRELATELGTLRDTLGALT